jgi:REP element-mobilizing transposase RayT
MGRSSRLDWKSAVHHVMARGIEKCTIFRDDNDRARFVSRIEKCVAETGVSIYAWALMPNHIHLLIKTGNKPLSKFMQKLLTGHANYFNKKYNRVGHLFQNRYKSILVQAEIYLLKLVRYIHINPLQAAMVSDYEMLKRYPWTGHPGLVYPGYYPWQETAQVLNTFSANKTDKTKQYTQFIEESEEIAYQDGRFNDGSFLLGANGLFSLGESREEEVGGYSQYRILGDIEYARKIYDKVSRMRKGQLRNREFEHDSVIKILEYAAKKWRIPRTVLTSKRRTRSVSRAREFACYALVNVLGMSLVDSGRILNLSCQGVHEAKERFLPDYDFDTEIKNILN